MHIQKEWHRVLYSDRKCSCYNVYAEGGSTQKADLAFELMSRRNMISWMVLISAFSQAGDLEKPIFFFFLIKCISEVLYLGIL